ALILVEVHRPRASLDNCVGAQPGDLAYGRRLRRLWLRELFGAAKDVPRDLRPEPAQADDVPPELGRAGALRLAQAGHVSCERAPGRPARLDGIRFVQQRLETDVQVADGRDAFPEKLGTGCLHGRVLLADRGSRELRDQVQGRTRVAEGVAAG